MEKYLTDKMNAVIIQWRYRNGGTRDGNSRGDYTRGKILRKTQLFLPKCDKITRNFKCWLIKKIKSAASGCHPQNGITRVGTSLSDPIGLIYDDLFYFFFNEIFDTEFQKLLTVFDQFQNWTTNLYSFATTSFFVSLSEFSEKPLTFASISFHFCERCSYTLFAKNVVEFSNV